MNEQVSVLEQGLDYGISLEQRNKVLRNTYWLLAISLVPTVIGAWAGVAFGLGQLFSGALGMVLFLAVAFGFMYAIEKTKTSATGVPVLLAFTFFMGLMMSRLIESVLGFKNGPDLIMTAFGGTAGVFLAQSAPLPCACKVRQFDTIALRSMVR